MPPDAAPLGMRLLPMWLLLSLSSHGGAGDGAQSRGPVIVLEPPSEVLFTPGAGSVLLPCSAEGRPAPRVRWIDAAGAELPMHPPHRRMFENGTLELSTIDVGLQPSSTLRCRAENARGAVLSRLVKLRPVSSSWQLSVEASAPRANGLAALRCAVHVDSTSSSAPPVRVDRWYRDDAPMYLPTPAPDAGAIVAGAAGEWLLLRNAAPARFGCAARAVHGAETRRAPSLALRLRTDIESPGSAPRLVATTPEVAVPAGTDFCIPCVATDHPPPHYTWYRERAGRLEAVRPTRDVWLWADGAAVCFERVTNDKSGGWLCKAYNALGDATAHTRVIVDDVLAVTIEPTLAVVSAGGTARFACKTSHPAELSWLHDTSPLPVKGPTMELRGVSRAHRGMYQCVARSSHRETLATAELQLADSAPELVYTFIEQALRGGAVSLRCAAAGAPPPRIQWLRDDMTIDTRTAPHRYAIGEDRSPAGDVVSTLNISSAAPEDGGRYTCRAINGLGEASHSARLNIYGPPLVRATPPLRVVAGSDTTVYCPYAGYPISSVQWYRISGAGAEAVRIPEEGRVSARGEAMRLKPALATDAGRYACTVKAPDGAAARREIDLQVRNPPKISPFMFSPDLTEGSTVQVLCGVSAGDKPLYFSWFRDGAPLPPDLQIEEKSLNEFSLLMFSELTARHSGDYTCRVANHAATVNYTATLSVKVPPSWTREPQDMSVVVGSLVELNCAAGGRPVPTITWHRRQGTGADEHWTEIRRASSEGVLSLGAASRALAGLYRCSADNGVGPALLKHVNVVVHEPAQLDSGANKVSCVAAPTSPEPCALECVAKGDPPLSVHWTYLGRRLDSSVSRWSASERREAAEGVLRSRLELRGARAADSGEYGCHAANPYGRAERAFVLHVDEPPPSVGALRLRGVGARWLRISWKSSSSQVNYLALCAPARTPRDSQPCNLTLEAPPQRVSEPDGWVWARIWGLKPGTAMALRVAASNAAGLSPYSDPLLAATLDEAPSKYPLHVRVRPAGSGELHVSWTVLPNDGWNGEPLGYAVSWRSLDGDASQAGTCSARGSASGSITLEGLPAGTRIAIVVRAFTRAGLGPPSPSVSATTADTGPDEPSLDVRCEGTAAGELHVRWSPPPRAPAHLTYDVIYSRLDYMNEFANDDVQTTVGPRVHPSAGESAILRRLSPSANYSISVRAHNTASDAAPPTSTPIICTTSIDASADGTEAIVRRITVVPAGTGALRVVWLPPRAHVTHYQLYVRELPRSGSGDVERAVRVEAGDSRSEVSTLVQGLRAGAVYELRVRAHLRVGVAPFSQIFTAQAQPINAPAPPRVWSISRTITARPGERVRLRCGAEGAAPMQRRWTPVPARHTLGDDGDLILMGIEASWAGNYTCTVRNPFGTDSVTHVLRVARAPPAPQSPRLVRADTTQLVLAWDPLTGLEPPLLGYTVWWRREVSQDEETEVEHELRWQAAAFDARGARVTSLACGSRFRIQLRAHNAAGATPPSLPLFANTQGERPVPPSGKEFIWVNATTMRLNVASWATPRCALRSLRLSLRVATPHATWRHLPAPPLDQMDAVQVDDLSPGMWHEVKVEARSPAGVSRATYRAATLTQWGESIGEAERLSTGTVEGSGDGRREAGRSGPWTALLPTLLAAALAVLLLVLVILLLVRSRRRSTTAEGAASRCISPQLYSTEPSKNKKGAPMFKGDASPQQCEEISPYATFSMAMAPLGEEERECSLRLVSLTRERGLAAAPQRGPRHSGVCDSDSASSDSSCAACNAHAHAQWPQRRAQNTHPLRRRY